MAYRLLIGLALLLIAGCDSPQAARRIPATTTTVATTDTVKVANNCGTNASAASPSVNVASDPYKCYWSVAVPANLALVECAELRRARAALLDDQRIDSRVFEPVPDRLLARVEAELRRRCD